MAMKHRGKSQILVGNSVLIILLRRPIREDQKPTVTLALANFPRRPEAPRKAIFLTGLRQSKTPGEDLVGSTACSASPIVLLQLRYL